MQQNNCPKSGYQLPAMRAALGLYAHREEEAGDREETPLSPELLKLIYRTAPAARNHKKLCGGKQP